MALWNRRGKLSHSVPFKVVYYRLQQNVVVKLSGEVSWFIFCLQVIVQNYNSVLTLSRLYTLSDALVVHENDTVHKICSQLMNIKHISISDLNKVIAHQLGSVLQPAYTADSPVHYSRNPIGIIALLMYAGWVLASRR